MHQRGQSYKAGKLPRRQKIPAGRRQACQYAATPCKKPVYRDGSKGRNARGNSRRTGYRKNLSAHGFIYSGMREAADNRRCQIPAVLHDPGFLSPYIRCPYPGGDLFRSVYLHELHPLPYKRIPGHRRHCMADPPERFLCPETLQGRAGNQYRGIYSTLQAGGSQSPPNLQRQKPYRDFQLPLFLKPVLFSECFQEKIWSDTYAVQKKDAACMTNRMPPQPMRMTSCLVQIIPFHFSALYLTDKTYS